MATISHIEDFIDDLYAWFKAYELGYYKPNHLPPARIHQYEWIPVRTEGLLLFVRKTVVSPGVRQHPYYYTKEIDGVIIMESKVN